MKIGNNYSMLIVEIKEKEQEGILTEEQHMLK